MTNQSHWKFKLGQEVQRRKDVYDQNSALMTGIVVRRYEDLNSQFGPYYELYQVLWESSKLSNGYLPHGLTAKEE